MGLTLIPCSASMAATTSTANPAPTRTRPNPNLAVLDGSLPLRASRIHSHAKIGANAMMNSEFSDWYQVLGNSMPNTTLFVSRSANRFSVDPACSNSDQNNAAARKSTPITQSRLRSSDVQPGEKNSQPKNTTVRMRRKYPAASATCVGVIGIRPL